MKIAVWHNLPSGGAKRALYHHVKGLVERGHTLECWCPASADTGYLPLREWAPEHVLPLGIRHRGHPALVWMKTVAQYRGTSERLAALMRHSQDCARAMEAGGFDVLFANSSRFLNSAGPIGRCLDMPRAVYLQEPYRALHEAHPQIPWLALDRPPRFWMSPGYYARAMEDAIRIKRFRILAREELLNARAFDLILVNSLFSRESVMRAYGLDSKVCPLGVDGDLFRPNGKPREPFVVGVGAVHPAKGLERCIRALAAIDSARRPALVWVGNAGQPEHCSRYTTLAAQLGVRFTLRVSISDAELVDVLSRATLMLYAPVLEPFGFAPLEANACEVPVVGVAEGGLRETIRDGVNGSLVGDAAPEALAEAVLRFLESPELCHRTGRQAREYVRQNWSWAAAIDALEQRLQQTAGRWERKGKRQKAVFSSPRRNADACG